MKYLCTACCFTLLIGRPIELKANGLSDDLQGRVLLEELGCVACHPSPAVATSSKQAPRLSAVASRVNPYYLEQFIQAPHTLKPGTTMPDVMSHLDAPERRQTARSITHFLLSLDKSDGFDLDVIDLVAAEQGEERFHTVGCVACHSPRDAAGRELLSDSSKPLGALEKKYNTRSLAKFLRAPHQVRPSGRMPNLQLSDREADQIAHYLLRETKVPGHLRYTLFRGRVAEGLDVNVTKEKSGHVDDFSLEHFQALQGNTAIVYDGYLHAPKAGDYTFYLKWNGGQFWLNDQEVANLVPSTRRGVKQTQVTATLKDGWQKIKLVYIHTGKEPKFSLEMEGPGGKRQPIDASRLSVSNVPIPAYRPYRVDAELATAGKQRFLELGCVNCHNDIKGPSVELPALNRLNASRGCLSGRKGRWPDYRLSEREFAIIRPLLANIEQNELAQTEIVQKTLVAFNCIACHERAGLGGVSPERNEYFVGNKKELGNQGRIPPPLTLVGAKLPASWIKEVLLNGKLQREYLATRMPQFGEPNVGHLVTLFENLDKLEKVVFPEIKDVEAYKKAGHELIGSTGFACIACHDFNGQKAAGPGAMDIIHSTERLKKDWFYLYLLNPARFQPGTIMPSAWPGGHAFKEEILGGDTKKQIESIWVYLSDGTRARNPLGLSRKSPELRVTDEPVICRGRGNAGYRGIAVGYPARVSLAFDSEEMNLRLLWKGEFATVSPGRFSARGRDRVEFPPGIPFHRLGSLEDNWPYKRKTDYLFPQDHGYRFRGYQLDGRERPTFLYDYGDIQVQEFFEDLLDDDKVAFFRRTFTFEAPRSRQKFYFRAAAGRQIKKVADSFVADRLTVTLHSPHTGIVREGEPQELLIPLELPQGKTKLVVDYKW